MSTGPGLSYAVSYQGTDGSAKWEGRAVGDTDGFRTFLRGPVRDRVRDAEAEEPFAAALRAVATTGMATDFLQRLLSAVPPPLDWEIGEALAECVLTQESAREVCWPWNTVRDRRTPRASLPGADLVGFCRIDGGVLLLFGEVKTSSDTGTPPNVMYGGSGMTWQLEESMTQIDIQRALLCWLLPRCSSPEHRALYQAAVARYLASQGKEILLVGVLLRDTRPDERDLRSRARALAARLAAPTRIEIFSWYLPIPIAQWPAELDGGTP